jgi:hypothetical protein
MTRATEGNVRKQRTANSVQRIVDVKGAYSVQRIAYRNQIGCLCSKRSTLNAPRFILNALCSTLNELSLELHIAGGTS